MGFDHIDTRVASIAQAEPFYDRLMPLLGFTRKKPSFVDDAGDWHAVDANDPYNTIEYYAPGTDGQASFFIGFIERAGTPQTWTRIAFRVGDAKDPEWLRILREIGAKNIEPSEDMQAYPAIFFEDPCGTKLELVSRKPS